MNRNLCTEVPKSSANCRPRWEKRILVFGESGAARALATHCWTPAPLTRRSPHNSSSRRFWYSRPLFWGCENEPFHFKINLSAQSWLNTYLYISRIFSSNDNETIFCCMWMKMNNSLIQMSLLEMKQATDFMIGSLNH